jgi:hypothetical protein
MTSCAPRPASWTTHSNTEGVDGSAAVSAATSPTRRPFRSLEGPATGARNASIARQKLARNSSQRTSGALTALETGLVAPRPSVPDLESNSGQKHENPQWSSGSSDAPERIRTSDLRFRRAQRWRLERLNRARSPAPTRQKLAEKSAPSSFPHAGRSRFAKGRSRQHATDWPSAAAGGERCRPQLGAGGQLEGVRRRGGRNGI